MQAVSRNHRLASGTDGLHVGDCKDIGSGGGIGGMLPPAEYIVKISQRKKEQMKYDDLEAVKQYLYGKVENKNTARKYYSALVKLFRDVETDKDIKRLGTDFYTEKIPLLFKTRNEVSAVKSGLQYFGECTGAALPPEDFYHAVNQKKRNRSIKPKKTLYLDEIKRKVNQISDERLKYAYRLALVSGLRVSELAGLDADKITFEDGKICVNVTNGKGGSNGTVVCLPDAYLYERLQAFTRKNPEGRLFYAESTLRKKAWEMGLECHDFRRIFAITKRNDLKKTMPVSEANEEVRKSLRHARFSTTKRYLFNRKLVFRK